MKTSILNNINVIKNSLFMAIRGSSLVSLIVCVVLFFGTYSIDLTINYILNIFISLFGIFSISFLVINFFVFYLKKSFREMQSKS